MKMKEFEPRGGGGGRASLAPPLDPPMETTKKYFKKNLDVNLCVLFDVIIIIRIVWNNVKKEDVLLQNLQLMLCNSSFKFP